MKLKRGTSSTWSLICQRLSINSKECVLALSLVPEYFKMCRVMNNYSWRWFSWWMIEEDATWESKSQRRQRLCSFFLMGSRWRFMNKLSLQVDDRAKNASAWSIFLFDLKMWKWGHVHSPLASHFPTDARRTIQRRSSALATSTWTTVHSLAAHMSLSH